MIARRIALGSLSLIAIATIWIGSLAAQGEAPPMKTVEFAIALHGGAGLNLDKLTEEQKQQRIDALHRILEIGRKILADGGTAMDAVEETVRALEDEPLFNAGHGAIFNMAGKHELDACIMDGATHRGGAVTCVTTVKNPISLARLVMGTKHELLAGDGAEAFADTMKGNPKIERVPNSYFSTEARRKSWLEAVEKEKQQQQVSPQEKMGTVGCVARDKHGNLAAATSTGGYVNKMVGRVGDTPIVGHGNYADNATCAVSGTGRGEYFMRTCGAFHVSALMAYKGLSVEDAVKEYVDKILPAEGGGVIAVDRDGHISMRCNTAGMPRAAADSTGHVEIKLER